MAGFRGVSRILQAQDPVGGRAPSHSAGRLWWLRLGYYKLSRALPHGDDWVWVLDHTVQIGPEKCLVILGVRLRDLSPRDAVLTHTQVEPLALYPVRQSNGQVVFEQLCATERRTGVPRALLSDGGSDLQAGITTYCQRHPGTARIYDIKHKTAVLLKRALHADAPWQTFTNWARQIRKELQQTPLAALCPPSQRSKARYMNLAPLLTWMRRIRTLLQQPALLAAEGIDADAAEHHLGWLRFGCQDFAEWVQLLDLCSITERMVRQYGLFTQCHHLLASLLPATMLSQRAQYMREQLLDFVAQHAAKARPNERLPGSTEVIESVFGKLKSLEGEYASQGFSSLLLSVPALVGPTTPEVVQCAMEAVPTRKIAQWTQQQLGTTLASQRKKLNMAADKAEQKPDQLSSAA